MNLNDKLQTCLVSSFMGRILVPSPWTTISLAMGPAVTLVFFQSRQTCSCLPIYSFDFSKSEDEIEDSKFAPFVLERKQGRNRTWRSWWRKRKADEKGLWVMAGRTLVSNMNTFGALCPGWAALPDSPGSIILGGGIEGPWIRDKKGRVNKCQLVSKYLAKAVPGLGFRSWRNHFHGWKPLGLLLCGFNLDEVP